MITSSGIIPTLVHVLSNERPDQLRNVLRSVSILDTIVYGFQNGFQILVTAGGLDLVIQRVKAETDFCVELADKAPDSTSASPEEPVAMETAELPAAGQPAEDVAMAEAESSAPEAKQKMDFSSALPINANVGEAPYDRLMLLRALLKFILHMMQTSGTADRLRNLIDSTVPKNLLEILAYSKTFGPGVYSLAVNIMSTFIHNEPTSLSILQELKLPQTFLHSMKQYIPFSPEVISAIPTAFGAICLNQDGLQMYNSLAPMDPLLDVFTKEENLRALIDNEIPQIIGGSLDELMRHQTSLKEGIMQSVASLTSRIYDICKEFPATIKDESALALNGAEAGSDSKTEEKERERKDNAISQYIDVITRVSDLKRRPNVSLLMVMTHPLCHLLADPRRSI